MKRAITALASLAILAFTASVTMADYPGATGHIPPTPSPKPLPAFQYFTIHYTTGAQFVRNGHYFYMGTNPSHYDGGPANAFSSMNSQLRTILHDNNVNFLVWRHLDDAADYYNVSPWAPDVEAVTLRAQFISRPGKAYIMVNIPETIPVGNVSAVTVHEQGHAFDYAFGNQIGSPAGVSQAATSNYKNKLAADWLYINGLNRNQVFLQGVPNKRTTDKAGTTWIAYNPSPTATNEQIIKDLYPWLFDGSADANSELFAHFYQAFQNAWVDDCPYSAVPDGMGGTVKYLNWPNTFTHFRNVKANISGGYFRTMWYQTGSFIP